MIKKAITMFAFVVQVTVVIFTCYPVQEDLENVKSVYMKFKVFKINKDHGMRNSTQKRNA